MKYKQNEIPRCPHCQKDVDCHIGDGEPDGIQHIALHRSGETVDVECEWCYEWFTVKTLVPGNSYELTS